MAVIVVVAGTHALAPSGMCQSRLLRHVLKLQIAKVSEESAGRLRFGREVRPASRVHQENVLQAVTVIIENRDPTSNRLQKELFMEWIAGFMFERQTRFGGNIIERYAGVNDRGVARAHWRSNMMRSSHPLGKAC